AGVAVLWLLWKFASQNEKDRSTGVLCAALVGIHPLIILCSRFVRPEIFLALGALGAFLAFDKARRESRAGWMCLAGFLGGILPGFHTNGLPVLAALAFLWFPIFGVKPPLRGLAWFLIGALGGFLAFVHFADWSTFLPGVKTLFFQEFNRPPLLE